MTDTLRQATLIEERENVLGLSFALDPDRLTHVALHCNYDPDLLHRLEIHLTDNADESKNTLAAVMGVETTEDGPKLAVKKHVIHLCVSDRPEFSESSLIKINRDLVHALRVISLSLALSDAFESRIIALRLMQEIPRLVHQVAYTSAKKVKTDESLRALLPIEPVN